MVQVCLNGTRGSGDGAGVPLSPGDMAASAARAVEAGASDVHLHPKSPCGHDTLSPKAVAATLEAVRSRLRVPVGVTTGAWAEPDPAARVARIRAWAVLPDHASVNWHEPGAEESAAALMERGVGVEAGIWSETDGAARFAASPLRTRVLRVLAEVTDPDPRTAADTARALLASIRPVPPVVPAAPGAPPFPGPPVLLHGEEGGTWPVLRLAGALGLATRVGLEDTLLLPDGRRASSNAELVAAGLVEYGRARRASRPGGPAAPGSAGRSRRGRRGG
ncbi:3-keto-5-aminohexanoate cleavage protein [Streptomyces fructofermentans]|nr:3-keto-5-aminohexanoate cleavage protein [Streptomyces fructofermentans]